MKPCIRQRTCGFRCLVIVLLVILGSVCQASAQGKETGIAAVYSAPDTSHPGGRLEVFVGRSGQDGGIFHTWETVQGPWQTPWIKYSPAPDNLPHGLVAGKDDKGRIMVAWIANRNLFVLSACSAGASLHTPAYRFASERIIPAKPQFTFLTSGTNSDHRVELFALDSNGYAWVAKQIDDSKTPEPGCPAFLPLKQISTIGFRKLSATQFADGRLAIVAVGKDGHVYFTVQSSPSGSWLPVWASLEGHDISDALAQESADKRLEVVAVGGDQLIYHRYQVASADVTSSLFSWGAWELRNPVKSQQPFLFARNANGVLQIFFQDTNNSRRRMLQTAQNGTWPSSSDQVGESGKLVDEAWAMDASGVLAVVALHDVSKNRIEIIRQAGPNDALWYTITGPSDP